jgi:hypothetical protein
MIRLLWLLLSHRDRRCPEVRFFLVVRSNPLREPRSLVLFRSVTNTRQKLQHPSSTGKSVRVSGQFLACDPAQPAHYDTRFGNETGRSSCNERHSDRQQIGTALTFDDLSFNASTSAGSAWTAVFASANMQHEDRRKTRRRPEEFIVEGHDPRNRCLSGLPSQERRHPALYAAARPPLFPCGPCGHESGAYR